MEWMIYLLNQMNHHQAQKSDGQLDAIINRLDSLAIHQRDLRAHMSYLTEDIAIKRAELGDYGQAQMEADVMERLGNDSSQFASSGQIRPAAPNPYLDPSRFASSGPIRPAASNPYLDSSTMATTATSPSYPKYRVEDEITASSPAVQRKLVRYRYGPNRL